MRAGAGLTLVAASCSNMARSRVLTVSTKSAASRRYPYVDVLRELLGIDVVTRAIIVSLVTRVLRSLVYDLSVALSPSVVSRGIGSPVVPTHKKVLV